MPEHDEPTPTILYTIYEHPIDYRKGYVVREWLITPGERQPGRAWRAQTLEEAQKHLPNGAQQVSGKEDDPTIVGTWM